jgi:hypothetical protein
MPLQLIEPSSIWVKGAVPLTCHSTGVHYLGYGRNAWHATWANKYYPNSVSFDADELKRLAENRRVQGSVFRIQSVPLLVLRRRRSSLGIMPINERSKYEYDNLIRTIKYNRPAFFWRFFPSSSRNWLLVFNLTSVSHETVPFTPLLLKSVSGGPNYHLYWVDQRPAPDCHQFQEFAVFLSEYLLSVPGEEPAAETLLL